MIWSVVCASSLLNRPVRGALSAVDETQTVSLGTAEISDGVCSRKRTALCASNGLPEHVCLSEFVSPSTPTSQIKDNQFQVESLST